MMKNPLRSLRRRIPLLTWAVFGISAFNPAQAAPNPNSPSGKFDTAENATIAALKKQGYIISSLTEAAPTTSYPASGGYAGFINAAHAESTYEYYAAYYSDHSSNSSYYASLYEWYFGGSGTPTGMTGSSLTGVSAKNAAGNYYLCGYGDTTSFGYTAFSSNGRFSVNNGVVTWSGTPATIAGLPAGAGNNAFMGISADGTATGYYVNGSSSFPFVVSPPGSTPIILPKPAGVTSERPTAINATGSVIVSNNPDPFGSSTQSGSCTLNFYGSNAPTPAVQSIGKFPGSVATYSSGISADGTTVSGFYIDGQGSAHPMIWAANVFTDIGASAPAGSKLGQAYASTADGSTVVGYGPFGTNAFTWTAKGGMQYLPYLTGKATSVAECISSDGEYTGGASFDSNFNGAGVAQIWTAGGNTYNLQTALAVLGVDTTGWVLNQVTAIVPSSDGSYLFVGNGTHNGLREGFIFELDVPVKVAVPAPTITTQPASQTVQAGANVTFTVAASGTSLSYQWYFNGTAIGGATSASITATVAAANSGSYTVTVTNAGGSVTSNGAVLAVQAPGAPTINIQPQSETMATGSTVVFTATTNGTVAANSVQSGAARPASTAATSYQWFFNGVAISGAANSTLILQNVSSAKAGSYSCLISNSAGSALSNSAVLAVTTTSNPGRLVNLSILTAIQDSLTVGFVVGGSGVSGSQGLLIRAVGPTLGTTFGYPGAMPDPSMTVIRQNDKAVLYTNTGWKTSSDAGIAALNVAAATGAFPLINPSLDSAVAASVPSVNGGYAVQITGKSGDSGSVIAEMYDNTPTYTATSPRLVNMSSLKLIPIGGSLSMGFVVGGSTSKTVLIRAAGPALIGFGYSSSAVMADPKIVLQQQNNGAVLATNTGWGGDAQVTAAAAAVGGFAFTDLASKDSAVILTLPPVVGGYSATVSSVGGGGGEALVEVYEVP